MLQLQKKILQNVLNSCIEQDTTQCNVYFSRSDRAEITLMKNLFEIEAHIQQYDATTHGQKWSEMINSSSMPCSYRAQAQYLAAYVPELMPEIKKQHNKLR